MEPQERKTGFVAQLHLVVENAAKMVSVRKDICSMRRGDNRRCKVLHEKISMQTCLMGQVSPSRIHNVAAGQAASLCNFLQPKMLLQAASTRSVTPACSFDALQQDGAASVVHTTDLDSHRVVGASLHGGIVRSKGYEPSVNPADACDYTAAGDALRA